MRILTLSTLLFLSLTQTIFAQKAQNVDKIIAKIDNYYILKSEVEQLYVRSKQQGQEISKCQALESMAIQKLMVAKAEIDSVIVEEDMIKGELDGRMSEMARMYGGEKNIVEQFGKTIEALKSEVRSQVKEQLTAQKMQRTITEKVKVTPNEVKKFFAKIPKDSIPTVPTQVEIAQIVKFAKVTKDEKNVLISRLNGFKKQIEEGEDFATLAKLYSEDLGSKEQGGDLSWAKRGQMVPEFEAAAMRMKANEISDIVESDFGFHLIQTLEIRGQEYHARHILLRPDYARLDVTDATKFLDSLRQLIVIDTLSFEKAVKLHSEDDATKYNGGFLSNPQTGEKRLSMDQTMEPTLYFMLDTMKVGTITVPVTYRSGDGKTGMKILQFKKKYEPHIANLKDDFELIQQYALSEKSNREVERWFKNALGEVFVKIDPEYESCKILAQ